MQADEELFKKYEKAFHDKKTEEMIRIKQEWTRLNPDKKFYAEYSKYIRSKIPQK